MSSRKLREKPRVCYYEPEEPSLDEYIFCERCSDYVYEYCAVHGPLLVIPDDKVPSKPNFPSFVPRAALTIPHVFLHLARSIIPGAGVGVFSTLTLPRGVRFGPYRGLRSTSVDSMYCWQIYDRNNKRSHVVDAADANRSNWMRYVNCSRHWSEQNLVAYQYKGQLYYRTIKPVPRFTELLVFYGGEFARALRVRLPAYNAPRAFAAKFGAPIAKKPRLVTPKIHKETSIKKLKKSDQRKDRIEQPKSETNRTVEDIPAQKSKIVETRDELYSKYKENTNTSDYSDVHKDISENKVSADQSIKSNVSQKLAPYSCDTCQKCFTAKSSLVAHLHIHTGDKPFKCSICKKCFSRKTNLATHIRTHTGEKPFKCSICKKCFSLKSSLDYHIRTHTGEKPFNCSICKKCFSDKSTLARHIRTHTGEKPFKCSICKKCFNHKPHLARHIRTHTGEKPFNCSICKKCFSLKSSLDYHIRTHTGEKPFNCSICKKCFSDKSTLARHIRTHTGEKPFKCSICKNCFSQKPHLARHIRTHTGEKPFNCSICKKCFSDKFTLARHIRTHTGEKPFKCSICKKCFNRKSYLKSHSRTHTAHIV